MKEHNTCNTVLIHVRNHIAGLVSSISLNGKPLNWLFLFMVRAQVNCVLRIVIHFAVLQEVFKYDNANRWQTY